MEDQGTHPEKIELCHPGSVLEKGFVNTGECHSELILFGDF